jgi:hypothetical protein
MKKKKKKNIDYKCAKEKVLRKTCGPREDGVSNVGYFVMRYFVKNTDYLVLGQKSGSL